MCPRLLATVSVLLTLLLASPTMPARAQDPPPLIGPAVASWSLQTTTVFPPWACATGKNRVETGADGLELHVTGRCTDQSSGAGIRADARRLTVADGEVAIEVRAPAGAERAQPALFARIKEERAYAAMWQPGRGIIELWLFNAPSGSVKLASRGDLPVTPPDQWARLALVMDGPRLWVTLDREPVLFAQDDRLDAGTVAVGVSRLGSPDATTEVLATWRNLELAPIEGGVEARAPRIPRELLPPPAVTRPSRLTPVVSDDLRTPALFWPDICTTDANTGSFGADGVRLRVRGKCFAASTVAAIGLLQPDVTMKDGAARFGVRIEQGAQRIRIGISLVDREGNGPTLTGVIIPARGLAGIFKEGPEGSTPLGTRTIAPSGIPAEQVTSLALQREGDRAWLLLNDEPVVVAEGVPSTRAAPVAFVGRMDSLDDADEVAATLTGFTASSIEGVQPAEDLRVTRAERPVIDPRYERIIAFIRTELAEDPGTDAAAAERRAIGQAMLGMISDTQVNLTVGPLPERVVARFQLYSRTVLVQERLMTFTPHVATALLLHEIVHAQQQFSGSPRGCVDREVDAAQWVARLWRAWFGPQGKVPPGDDIEAEITATVTLDNQGRLRQAVEEIYREQCAGR